MPILTTTEKSSYDDAVELLGTFGTVKINSAGGVKPSVQWGGDGGNPSPGDSVQYSYTGALDFASPEITVWPKNIASPVDADIWDSANGTFIENAIISQYHEWRLQFEFSGKSAGQTTGASIIFTNPISGFVAEKTVFIPNERTSGAFTVVFGTVADSQSLPAPTGSGIGYELILTSDDPITITLDSLLRVSYVTQF